MCINPSKDILSRNSNPKIWTDIGYIFKTFYDLQIPNSKDLEIPNTYCIKIDSPAIISYVSKYDCRSNPNASSIITKTSSSLSINNTTIAIVIGVIVCLLIMGCGVFMVMSMHKSSHNSNKKKNK